MGEVVGDSFNDSIIALQDVLYHVSYTLLKNPEDQADAVQEALKKAISKKDTLRNKEYLKTWLVRILINECYSILRRKKREVLFDIDKRDSVADSSTPPPMANMALYSALMQLEEKYRILITLHYIDGYLTKEIGSILHLPEGTVKTRLVKARKLLKDILEDKEAYCYGKA